MIKVNIRHLLQYLYKEDQSSSFKIIFIYFFEELQKALIFVVHLLGTPIST